MRSKDDLIERLDAISDEIEALESPEDTYDRGVEDGRQEIITRTFPTGDQLFAAFFTGFFGILLLTAILAAIWFFIHWAAKPDMVTVCTQYASGERECHIERSEP